MRLRVDFERQERDFLNEVDDMNAFDVVLRQAQDKMLGLGQDVDELESEKDRFTWELDVLGQQQTELADAVEAMEKMLLPPAGTQSQGRPQLSLKDPANATPADVQRQNILQLQLNINAQLRQLDDEVGDLCEQISDMHRITGLPTTGTGGATADQEQMEQLEERRTMVDQIRRILRSQLEALVWVDKESDALLDRVQRTASDVLALR